ncbi:hypothetical protein G6F42_028827 [Rhizopus arrhizus]|nr:hypothetical protein G6F42_028827 [Rhizopus arrhizus]
MSPSQEPTKTKPSAKAANEESSIAKLVSLTMGKSSSDTSSRAEPAYKCTYPKIADCLMERLPRSKCSDNRAIAGSDSSRTPEFTIPIANKAPALM